MLVVLSRDDELNWLSLRNVPEVHLLAADQLNTYDVLVSDDVVFTKDALDEFLGVPRPSAGEEDEANDHDRRPARRHRRAGGLREELQRAADRNWYTFLVHPDANKTEIKIAIQQIFNVRVLTVNTLNREGKRKRTRTGWGKRKDTKRAMVKLADGDRIDAFGGPVS